VYAPSGSATPAISVLYKGVALSNLTISATFPSSPALIGASVLATQQGDVVLAVVTTATGSYLFALSSSNPLSPLLWSYAFSSLAVGTAAIGPSALVFPTKSSLVGLSYTGALLWTFNAASNDAFVSTPSLGADGTVYASTSLGSVYALSGTSGAQLWSYTGSPGSSCAYPPIVSSDGTLYVISGGCSTGSDIVLVALRSQQPAAPPSCSAKNFTEAARMDLQGELLSVALSTSVSACQSLCCSSSACQGYSFSQGVLDAGTFSNAADCFLYTKITTLYPNSLVNSGLLTS
jgi:hypothetical protein